MKPKLLIILLLIILGIGLETYDSFSPPPQITEAPIENQQTMNTPAPDFTFTTLDQKTRNLSELKGKTIILNFWATWCAPCIKEFPDMLELAHKNPENLIFLAISVDENPAQIAPFLKRLPEPSGERLRQPNVLIAQDPEKKIAQDLFGTVMYPETFIIGEDLTIRRKIVGLIDWKTVSLQDLTAAVSAAE